MCGVIWTKLSQTMNFGSKRISYITLNSQQCFFNFFSTHGGTFWTLTNLNVQTSTMYRIFRNPCIRISGYLFEKHFIAAFVDRLTFICSFKRLKYAIKKLCKKWNIMGLKNRKIYAIKKTKTNHVQDCWFFSRIIDCKKSNKENNICVIRRRSIFAATNKCCFFT